MQYGTVKHWNAAQGFGFITLENDDDVFLHVSNLDRSLEAKDVREGMRVKFDISSDMKGDKAINIRRA